MTRLKQQETQMAKVKLRMRLGDLMVAENIITEPQLMDALKAQKSSGKKLGGALIDLGLSVYSLVEYEGD